MSEVKIQKVTYYRTVKKPTLKQFLMRRAFQEVAEETRDEKGVVPDGDRVIPKSAKQMRNKLKGLTAEEIAERRPDLVAEYHRKYGGK